MGNQLQVSQWMAENPATFKTAGPTSVQKQSLMGEWLICTQMSLIQNMQHTILLIYLTGTSESVSIGYGITTQRVKVRPL